jgi:hypothetical protein
MEVKYKKTTNKPGFFLLFGPKNTAAGTWLCQIDSRRLLFRARTLSAISTE